MASSMTFLSGILALVVWTNAKSYGVLGFFAVAEGLIAGNFWATIAPLMAEVVGLKEVPAGLNILWLSIVLPCTFSEPIALEIFTGTGSYLGTQLFTGFVYLAAAGCLVALRGWKIMVDSRGAGVIGDGSERRTDGVDVLVSGMERLGFVEFCQLCFRWAVV